MNQNRSPLPFRGTLMASLVLLAACGRDAGPKASPSPAAPAPAAVVDESQAMAFDAGRDLIGKTAPALAFKTIDGRTISLAEARGKRPVYLKFWATWCVTCRQQMAAFKDDFARYGRDVEVVAVNTGVNDDLTAVEAYRRDLRLPMPITIDDGRFAEAFHLKVTPQHVIIGRDGVIRYVGHLEDDRLHRELEAAIADMPLSARAAPEKARVEVAVGLTSVQGGRVRLDGPNTGAPRLVYFLSPWCETYLKDSRPAMARACQDTREALTRASADGRAQVIGVASGLSANAASVHRYLDRTGFQAPIVIDDDGGLFRRFGVQSFPAVIRLDAAGRPAGRVTPADIDALARQPSA